jgi:hypothetical protein
MVNESGKPAALLTDGSLPDKRPLTMNGHGSNESRSGWLTPQFGFQILTFFLGAIIAGLGAYYATNGDVRALTQEQARTTAALEEIRRQLPNSGVLELRLKAIEDEQKRQADRIEKFDAWVQLTREDLIRKGIIN